MKGNERGRLSKQMSADSPFGRIRKQLRNFERASLQQSSSQGGYKISKCLLLPRKRNYLMDSVKRQLNKQNKKKVVTLQGESFFATEVKLEEFNSNKKKKLGRIVDQSTAVIKKKERELQVERAAKIQQLYRKKSGLLHQLKLAESQVRTKSPIQLGQQSSRFNSLVVRRPIDKKRQVMTPHSRYFGQPIRKERSFDSRFLSENAQRKSPQSVSSLEKNRRVLDFIKKMNEQTIQRDLSRLSRFHKNLQSQLRNELELLKSQKRHSRCKAVDSTHFSSNFT